MGDGDKYRTLADAGLGPVSALVSSLPAGYTLGEYRFVNGVEYRLCFNASANAVIDQGKIASPGVTAGTGPNSVVVSTLSQGHQHIGAVVAVHATVPTANYFWGAVRGVVGGMIGDAASVPTGSEIALGANGTIQLLNLNSIVSGKLVPIGYVITTVSNGGAANGNAYIALE